MRRSRNVRRRLREERGYTLTELLTVMAILGTVLAGLTTVFVSGSKAEVDMNKRFQAQQETRVALDKLRREVHCASVASTATAASVTLTIPCVAGQTVTWCTAAVGSATNRFRLYRAVGGTCNATVGTRWADYLTTGNVFAYTAQSSTDLAKLHVDLPVSVHATKTQGRYELVDDIVFRNSSRTCIAGSPSPPC